LIVQQQKAYCSFEDFPLFEFRIETQ